MATKNVTLEKFYISEKFDENRNISFNLKKLTKNHSRILKIFQKH